MLPGSRQYTSPVLVVGIYKYIHTYGLQYTHVLRLTIVYKLKRIHEWAYAYAVTDCCTCACIYSRAFMYICMYQNIGSRLFAYSIAHETSIYIHTFSFYRIVSVRFGSPNSIQIAFGVLTCDEETRCANAVNDDNISISFAFGHVFSLSIHV